MLGNTFDDEKLELSSGVRVECWMHWFPGSMEDIAISKYKKYSVLKSIQYDPHVSEIGVISLCWLCICSAGIFVMLKMFCGMD